MKYLAPLLALAIISCSSEQDAATALDQWDGETKKETDAIVTLRLPGEPESILLNGEVAQTSIDRAAGTVKVLVPSDESGISCENTYIVKFKDGETGQLLANHCHDDQIFDVKPGDILDKRVTKDDIDNPDDDMLPPADKGFAPGESLAYEWSANGFEQLPSRYVWSGSGERTDVFVPNFGLGVPETDDVVWVSSCAPGGKVRSRVFLNLPDQQAGDRTTFRFESEKSKRTLSYPANFVDDGEFAGFEIVQSASDAMFGEMKAGTWAYMQMGDGDDAAKVRVSLKGASKALNAFLPACR